MGQSFRIKNTMIPAVSDYDPVCKVLKDRGCDVILSLLPYVHSRVHLSHLSIM